MFGMFEVLYAYLTRMLGNRSEGADPNGSLHAKVGDVKNAFSTIPKYGSAIASANLYSSSITDVTVYNRTGKGVIHIGAIVAPLSPSNGYGSTSVTVVADGRTLPVTTISGAGSILYGATGIIEYNTSIQIKMRITNPPNSAGYSGYLQYVDIAK